MTGIGRQGMLLDHEFTHKLNGFMHKLLAFMHKLQTSHNARKCNQSLIYAYKMLFS